MSRNAALRFVNIAHFFDHFFLLIFPTAALAIASAWDMSYADTLVLGTPLYVMFAAGTLPAGWLGDRFDRMKLMMVFFVGCGCSSLLIAAAPGPLALSAGLGLLGLFTAIYHPVGVALVTDLGKRTGRALAVNGVFGNMGLAGAAVATGLLADLWGWRSAFAIPGVVGIALGVAMYASDRRARRNSAALDRTPVNQPIAIDIRTQYVILAVVCIAALFGGAIFNAITVSLPKFFDERLIASGSDLGWIGASAGLVFAVAAFAQLPVGELLDRFGARPIMATLLAAQCLMLALLSDATGWTALILALLMVTAVFASIPVTGWLLGRYIRSDLRSRIMSVEYVLSLGMASAVVPLIAFMHGQGLGFNVQYVLLAGCAAIVALSALFLPGRRRSIGGNLTAQEG